MKSTTQPNPIKKVLETSAKFGFKPSIEFYQKVKINRKRWSLLVNGKKDATVNELVAVCNFFGANAKDYVN